MPQMAKALASQHITIYCIDAETGAYKEFASTADYKYLDIPSQGDDFFNESRKNIARVIHPDDIEGVMALMHHEVMRRKVEEQGTVSFTYRLMMGGEPVSVRMDVTMLDEGATFVVVVSNVDKLVRLSKARNTEREEKIEYLQVVRKLACDYRLVYYVDLETDDYSDLSVNSVYGDRDLPSRSRGFFAAMHARIEESVHPDDLDRVLTALDKDLVLNRVRTDGTYEVDYRVLSDGVVGHARMKLTPTNDSRHLIMTVADIEDLVKRAEEEEAAKERSRIYGLISQSLASQYATIYLVDVYTKHYIEFAATDIYRDLGAPASGDDFFVDSRENILRVIHPDDVDLVLGIMDRDLMTRKINETGSLSVTYRLMMGEKTIFARLNAAWARDHRHLIVGVEDVDEEMKRRAERQEVEERAQIYGYIAQSLANQYATIYYVDVYDETYIEFASSDIYKGLEVPPSGSNFFLTSQQNIQRVIHPDDADRIAAVFDRDRLTQMINDHGSVSLTYRLMIDGEPVYTSLRAVWADDMRHLIIGVSDVDAVMKKELAQKRAEEQSVTYAHIARSLANRYDSIYYVDAVTNSYVEYNSTDEYKNLNVQTAGDDFFEESRRNIQRLAYREDLKFALDAFNKENLLAELEVEKVFSTNYRLVLDGNPTYVNLRAVWADDKRHLIVCVANVDVEIKRERDHAQKLRAIHEKAIRDELTGIRNQNAYAEFEETLLQAMESGMQQPFAMVVCDVNGLKEVNDSMGHKAGDEYIREACRLVCTVFDHSPVFRTGGDEFVAVLQGDDYHNRDVLLGSIRSTVLANQDNGGVIVAVGMSAYQPEIDERPSDVFSRADDLMYENKKTLKGARL